MINLLDGESAPSLRCKEQSAGLDLGSFWDNSMFSYRACQSKESRRPI